MNPDTVERVKELLSRPPHLHCWHTAPSPPNGQHVPGKDELEACCQCPGTRVVKCAHDLVKEKEHR